MDSRKRWCEFLIHDTSERTALLAASQFVAGVSGTPKALASQQVFPLAEIPAISDFRVRGALKVQRGV